jgi:hypothetical protein
LPISAARAWGSLKVFLQHSVPENDPIPGAVIAAQTFGDVLGCNPHCRSVVTDGCVYGDKGLFRVALPMELNKLEAIFRHTVFRRLLNKGKITKELIARLSTWRHCRLATSSVTPASRPLTKRLWKIWHRRRRSPGLSDMSGDDADHQCHRGPVGHPRHPHSSGTLAGKSKTAPKRSRPANPSNTPLSTSSVTHALLLSTAIQTTPGMKSSSHNALWNKGVQARSI